MMIVRAPAKLNLCLYLGQRRPDGLHEIRSLFQPLGLSDVLTVSESERDEVICPPVAEDELADRALAALRRSGWNSAPLRIEIDKRIPIAAGLGGGSADAGAVLRLGAGEVDGLTELAAGLGADVSSQIEPRPMLVGGAGEVLEPLPEPGEYAVVLIPAERGLAAVDVYAEADRLGLGRDVEELDAIADRLRAAATAGGTPLGYTDLLVNDLQAAALSLAPDIKDALDALEAAGAARALVTGSGPAVFGLFEDVARADRAASRLPARFAGAIVSAPERFQ